MSNTGNVSVVIPCWNEARILPRLLEQLSAILTKVKIDSQIIIVDDHSTDNTKSIVSESLNFKIEYLLKKGRRGRTTSILQGIAYAKYDRIIVLNADDENLLPNIAVALSQDEDPSQITVIRNQYNPFASVLIFSKEILDRIKIRSRNWAFEHEFISKAQHAGYKARIITEKSAKKSRRWYLGKNLRHFHNLQSNIDIRFSEREIYPFSIRQAKEYGQGFNYRGKTFVCHTSLSPTLSAFHRLSLKQVLLIALIILVTTAGLVLNWSLTLTILIASLTIIYFGDLLFNLYLIYRSFAHPTEVVIGNETIKTLSDANCPTYTILCPLYKESHVIPQFVKAMSKLDYPPDKLQVILLLEQDDKDSITKARSLSLPSFVEILVVPDSHPKTKPKACNYGLQYAKGEYITIYDAEDVPEKTQLKKAILAFKILGSKTVCVQAKLNFYNPKQNLLTRIFTAEYSLWFDLVLTGLHSIGAPIPLGGTSNHFPTSYLRQLHGWDAFNVTEDCDLGMRLVKRGYKTAVIDSVTYEEANSGVLNWIRQRTRWIKGYIQTYFVHLRRPHNSAKFSFIHSIAFQIVVGGKVTSMFINPIMWIITVSYFMLRSTFGIWLEQFYPMPVLYMAVFSLIFGNFLYMYYYMIGCAKREYDDLIKYVVFVPLYWLGMSYAAWLAVIEMVRNPHYWSKTVHGLHLNNARAITHASSVIGYNINEDNS